MTYNLHELGVWFAAVSGVALLLYGFSGVQGVTEAVAGLRSVRVHSQRNRAVLRAWDWGLAERLQPVAWASLAVSIGSVALLGGWAGALVLVCALIPWSYRLEVRVDATSAVVKRTILGWAWSQTALHRPYAWVDGWGDFLDPEALWLGERGDSFEREPRSFELGWSSCYSGERANDLADRFNRAVAELQRCA
ncbi:MAG: hypothetical protein AAFQ82_21150 [Myxococcota bacterium]